MRFRISLPALGAAVAAPLMLWGVYRSGWAQQQTTGENTSAAATTASLLPLLPVVQTTDVVYFPGKPEMIAATRFASILPHPQGRYALIVREEEPPPPAQMATENALTGGTSLILWDGLAHRARVVWEQPALQGTQKGTVESVDWLTGSNTAVVIVSTQSIDRATGKPGEETHTLLFLDPTRDGHARVLRSQPGDFNVEVSPTAPVASILGLDSASSESMSPKPPLTMNLLTASGRIGQTILLPWGSILNSWSKEGMTRYGGRLEYPPSTSTSDKPRPTLRYFTLNLKTGLVSPLAAKPKEWNHLSDFPAAPTLALRLTTHPVPVSGEDPKPSREILHPLFLQSTADTNKRGGLMIAPNADQMFLLNDLSAAFFVSQDAAYVVPIYAMRRDQYEAATRAGYRSRTLSNAKHIGTAMMMYSQDYDEVLPPSMDVANIVAPYIKDSSAFNDLGTGKTGFSYLMNGEAMKGITQPATTPIGFLTGPGGRAMIYGDGHVEWKDKP